MSNSTRSLLELRLFVAVYEERSFTAAASREHATQSGVSQHIRKLEDSLDVKLFKRSTTSVIPTPAGDVYYQGCVDVLKAQHRADQAVRDFVGGSLHGDLVIGLMPTMTRSVLTPALAEFVTSHPNVSIHIVEAFSAKLTKQVRANEVAFAIVPAVQQERGVEASFFHQTPEFLVSGVSSALKHLAPIRLGDLGPLKIVLPMTINARRQRLETYLSITGAVVARRVELDTMLGALDLVKRTDWVTILPGLMIAADAVGDQVKVSPLVEPPLDLDLALIQPALRTMSRPAVTFLKLLKDQAELLSNELARVVGSAALPTTIKGSRHGTGPDFSHTTGP